MARATTMARAKVVACGMAIVMIRASVKIEFG
jgi:hypothetical protein